MLRGVLLNAVPIGVAASSSLLPCLCDGKSAPLLLGQWGCGLVERCRLLHLISA